MFCQSTGKEIREVAMWPKAKRFVVFPLVALVLLGLGLAAGCGGGTTPPPEETELSGKIREAGSTSVLPLAEELAVEFMKLHPRVRVETGGGGSGAGVTQCAAGTVEIGAVSRDIKITEPDLITYPIARDAVAIVVHAGNPITGLTLDQVARIYSGEITDWSQVGGKAGKIVIIAREEGSGTRDAFEAAVMRRSLVTKRAILQQASGAIRTIIALTPGSIGFLSFGYVDSSVKALAIDGAEANAANIASGLYTISQPLYFLTREQAKGLASEFIDFCLSSDGQSIVAGEGYISIK